jgi:hypothetical protein
MALLRLSVDGQSYDYDPNSLTMREALDLEKASGLTVPEFTDGLSKGRALSMVTLFWLARRRNGEEKLKFSDVDGVLASITITVLDGEDEDEAAPFDQG